jgi:ABC-2 type transport system permease protein
MRIYLAYFKMKFLNEMQYKVAALAGIATQFAWGFMYIMLFTTFINNSDTNSISSAQIVTYIWLQQAFYMLFAFWSVDKDIFDSITTGNLAYELTKPVDLYDIWFVKTLALKVAKTALRALPIFVICMLPFLGEFTMTAPISITAAFWFVITMIFSTILLLSYIMIIYVITITAISPLGVKITFSLIGDFFSGGLIPIPLMPDIVQTILKYTPFYYIQNIPFNIYNGYISGNLEIIKIIGIQIFWIVILISFGKWIMNKSMKKVVIQGG